MENPDFLKKKYDLHASEEVEFAARRTEARTGEKVPQKPQERIQNYLDRFKEIIEREDEHERERGMGALKEVLYDKLVIKEEDIPESYFDMQRRIQREQGYGDIDIEPEQRHELAEVIIADQKSSLDTWIDYFASPDAMYPDWLKYYAFRSMTQMGEYDKEKKQFTKRSKGTVKPFPDLNREALAYVLDAIEKKYGKGVPNLDALNDEEKERFQQLIQGESFPKLYAFAIEKVTPASQERLLITEGEWVKYDQGSDHLPLVESLQGHGTGWCTAGESTAETQLESGDFYVYYSLDEDGKPTVPRAAIRMEGNTIGEVRGIAEQQNLDPYIGDVVQEKLGDFGKEGEAYQKKAEDMKRLTSIESKTKLGYELSREDIRFLYEIERPVQGFGYQKDPRIFELKEKRDSRSDLSSVFECRPEQISFTETEALSGDIIFHDGDLDLTHLPTAEGLIFPETLNGHLDLMYLVTAEDITLPRVIHGSLSLNRLVTAEDITLPRVIYGSLFLNKLTTVEDLTFPDIVKGVLYLDNLNTIESLTLPEAVGDTLSLRGLTTARNLTLPRSIGGDLDIPYLTSIDGVTFPESVGGYVNAGHLQDADKEMLQEKFPQYAAKIR